ncbi:hypothetical protein MC885_017741 [Smutsia gigantea]|nr:hypothetical protein MC885_017741 [Smutsia gigantea]
MNLPPVLASHGLHIIANCSFYCKSLLAGFEILYSALNYKLSFGGSVLQVQTCTSTGRVRTEFPMEHIPREEGQKADSGQTTKIGGINFFPLPKLPASAPAAWLRARVCLGSGPLRGSGCRARSAGLGSPLHGS